MKKIIILTMLALLSACNTMSQDARIEIYPTVTASSIGNGVTLSIIVDDGRTSASLGDLGGGSTIMTSQDLSQTIGRALVDSFKEKGFAISSSNDPAAVQVMVTLEELNYTKNANTISTDVETKTRARVEVKNKGFIRTYSNSESRTIPFSANADSNNSQLSSTLRALIEKIAADNEILAAMVR